MQVLQFIQQNWVEWFFCSSYVYPGVFVQGHEKTSCDRTAKKFGNRGRRKKPSPGEHCT